MNQTQHSLINQPRKDIKQKDKINTVFLKLLTKNKPQTPANPLDKVRETTLPIMKDLRPGLDDT